MHLVFNKLKDTSYSTFQIILDSMKHAGLYINNYVLVLSGVLLFAI